MKKRESGCRGVSFVWRGADCQSYKNINQAIEYRKDKFNSQLIAATIKHEILTRILILLLLMKYEMFRHRYR